ncbi:MAG TPA: MOSC domain-containing protein [Acidimicrobiales bacterium]|nr:MOSC domain-containing protein [Acidimicrobiales bacterium]
MRSDGGIAGTVAAVHRSASYTFTKRTEPSIHLVAGLGVEGDAHFGATVRHRSRVALDPSQPNLRQVHLIQSELHDELRARGIDVEPGAMGENITTRGLDLLALPTGAVLRIGADAYVALTGLRNPCGQLNGLREGLLAAVVDRDDEGNIVRKAGVMGVVLRGGTVRRGDRIDVALPPGPHHSLERV